MNFIEALLLGLIQGVTEFLPVSSSGHLTLLGRVFAIDEAAMLSLATLLHVGTLISVFVVMRREIGAILRDIFAKKTWLLLVATVPAVLAALLLGDWIDRLFGGGMLGYSFLATAVILCISLLWRRKSDPDREIGYPEALIGGIGQAVAIIPGVSRSGTTITALLLSGIQREKAIRFSFLMAIPVILGGFLLDLFKLIKGGGAALLDLGIGNVVVGVLAAAISGYLVMEFMLRKLNRRGFLYCAIYVAILGALVLIDQNLTHFVFA
ncbi:MAG: undecaprenyl-diphosphate phosphatase [Saccharofermentanales bacterium]|jgi:undecaprenyl-diphosphatase